MKINSIKDLCEFIWYLEDKYHLVDFEIDGVKVWQYLRMEIYYKLAKETRILEQRNKSQQNMSVFVKNSLTILKNLFTANPFLELKDQKDVIVFTHNRSKKIEGEFEDIYTYSLIRELQSSNQSYLSFEKPFDGKHIRKRNSHTRYLDFILVISILFGKLYCVKDKHKLKSLIKIEKEIEKHTAKRIDLISLFKMNVGRYRLGNKFYLKLFRKLKPKTIYSVASYSYLGDMIAAAKTLGIKTIELQHGVISKYHMGYSFNKKEDLSYYSDIFYSWGDFWSKSVENAFDEVKIKGFYYFRDNSEIYRNIVKQNKIIILSQAALGEKIMDKTLEFINKFSEYEILYKLHPEEYGMYKKYSSYSQLSSYENLIFLEECDLYAEMSRSMIQIGVFSTALYEGMGFSCNTFLYELNGVEYMQEVIDSGFAKILTENVSIKETSIVDMIKFF